MTEQPATATPHRHPSDGRVVGLALAIAHLVIGLGMGYFADDDTSMGGLLIVFVGHFFCQVSLLGLWVGLGGQSVGIRICGAVAGTTYLILLLCFALEFEAMFVVMVSVAVGLISGVMLIVRRYARLSIVDETDAASWREGLQFSVRHLIVATTVAAIFSAVLRAMSVHVISLGEILVATAYAGVFVGVALVTSWAMLGSAVHIPRVILALVGSVGCGVIPGFIDNSGFILPIGMTLAQFIFLIFSLAVIRSAGYRLVALPPTLLSDGQHGSSKLP